jgi:hypothetical protein
MNEILLYKKLSVLPDIVKAELLIFIHFLSSKNRKQKKAKPKFGSAKGLFKMMKNFDEPMIDFNKYKY